MAVAAFGMRCAFHLLQPIMGRKALQHEKRRRFLKNVDGAERAGAGKDDAARREREKTTRSGGGRLFLTAQTGTSGAAMTGGRSDAEFRGLGKDRGVARASGLRFPPSSPASGLSPRLFPPRVRRGQRGGVSVPSPDVSSPCLFAVFRRRPRVAGAKVGA